MLTACEVGMKSALINVEFSFGRWSGDDAKAIEEPLKVLVSRMSTRCSLFALL